MTSAAQVNDDDDDDDDRDGDDGGDSDVKWDREIDTDILQHTPTFIVLPTVAYCHRQIGDHCPELEI